MKDVKPIDEGRTRLTGSTIEWLKSLIPDKRLGKHPVETLHIAAAAYLSDIFACSAQILSVHESRSTLSLKDFRLGVAFEQDKASACAKLDKEWRESLEESEDRSPEEALEQAWEAMPAVLAERAKKRRHPGTNETSYHRRPSGSRQMRKKRRTTAATPDEESDGAESPDPPSSDASESP